MTFGPCLGDVAQVNEASWDEQEKGVCGRSRRAAETGAGVSTAQVLASQLEVIDFPRHGQGSSRCIIRCAAETSAGAAQA